MDYIRKMQRDMDRYRAHEVRTKQMEDSMRLLKLRIQVWGGAGGEGYRCGEGWAGLEGRIWVYGGRGGGEGYVCVVCM